MSGDQDRTSSLVGGVCLRSSQSPSRSTAKARGSARGDQDLLGLGLSWAARSGEWAMWAMTARPKRGMRAPEPDPNKVSNRTPFALGTGLKLPWYPVTFKNPGLWPSRAE